MIVPLAVVAAITYVLGPKRTIALLPQLVKVGKWLVDRVTNPRTTTENDTPALPTTREGSNDVSCAR